MTKKLKDYSTLTFDCYGTMIDWEGGIWDAMQPVIWANNRSDIRRNDALMAFAEIETAQELETPDLIYSSVLERVHKKFVEKYNMRSSNELDIQFGESVPRWPAFADSADALRDLKKQFKLVILSNVHRAGFAASNAKLGVDFDAIYTAEDVGSYKPSPRNFDYMLDRIKSDLDVSPANILHTAQSLHHDHVPASRAGLDKAWIDRQDLENTDNWGATSMVGERPEVDWRFKSLAEMAAAVAAE